MKKYNISLLKIESTIDNIIGIVIDFLTKSWNNGKYAIIIIFGILLYLNWQSTVVDNVISPIKKVLNEGIKPSQLAIAISVGIVSGLSAPGLALITMIVLFLICSKLSFSVGIAEITIATAINYALTLLDLWTWKTIFMRLGTMIVPVGGLYIRPFIAGMIPYSLIALPALFIIYEILVHIF